MPSRQQADEDVKGVIDAFITSGETFSAAHVTMAVRAQALWAGTLGHERGVAPIVRRFYDNGNMTGYSQTMLGSFFAYHPIGQDPSTVDLRIGGNGWTPRVDRANFNDDGDATTPPSASQTPSTTRNSTPLSKDLYAGGRTAQDGDVVRVEYNAQGYAQLPKPMTNALGLAPGSGVMLEGQQLSGTCTLRASTDGEDPVACLQSASGALRLRDRALMPFGVGLHDDVTVTFNMTAGVLTLS